MGKLCAKGKAAAKRKYDVYPSAYANMYASAMKAFILCNLPKFSYTQKE